MRRRPAVRALAAILLAGALFACEKETRRAAVRNFRDLSARGLAGEEQAAALEAFVERYPEPKTNPHLARACTMLGDHHARALRNDIAASWYERAVRARPEDPGLLNLLGYHYARHGLNLDRAVTLLEEAARLAEKLRLPDRRQGLIKDSLGWSYRMRGNLPQAVAVLEEACRLAPGVPILRAHLADAYHALGERLKAEAIYLDLMAATPRGVDAETLGVLREIAVAGGEALRRELGRRIAAEGNAVAGKDGP